MAGGGKTPNVEAVRRMNRENRLKAIVWMVAIMVAFAWLMSRLLQSRVAP